MRALTRYDWTRRSALAAGTGRVAATNLGSSDIQDHAVDLFAVDAEGASAPSRLDFRFKGPWPAVFALGGSWLVAEDAPGQLGLYDLREPGALEQVASAPISGTLGSVAIQGNVVAAVTAIGSDGRGPGQGGLSTVWLRTYAIVEDEQGARLAARGATMLEPLGVVSNDQPRVVLDEGYAYVLVQAGVPDSLRTELVIVDLRDPNEPRRVGGLVLPMHARQLSVDRGIVLLSSYQVLAVDARRATAPRLLGELALPGSWSTFDMGVTVAEGQVFVTGFDRGLAHFAPDLPWRGAPGIATPTALPSPTPGPSPTATSFATGLPTATRTPRMPTSAPATRTRRPTRTRTATATATVTATPPSPLYLPRGERP
jgi:hypothetical protein